MRSLCVKTRTRYASSSRNPKGLFISSCERPNGRHFYRPTGGPRRSKMKRTGYAQADPLPKEIRILRQRRQAACAVAIAGVKSVTDRTVSKELKR